jgi:hypothetical protein
MINEKILYSFFVTVTPDIFQSYIGTLNLNEWSIVYKQVLRKYIEPLSLIPFAAFHNSEKVILGLNFPIYDK